MSSIGRYVVRVGGAVAVVAAAMVVPGSYVPATQAARQVVQSAAPLGRGGSEEAAGDCGAPVVQPNSPLYQSPRRDAPITVNFHLNDVSAQAGVQDFSSITRAISVADFDGDGWDDFFSANSSGGTRLWHNNHDGTFTNLAASVGITTTPVSYAWGAVWADFNEDGHPDLFIANGGFFGNPQNQMYENLYHTPCHCFRNVTNVAGVAGPQNRSWGVAAADYDNDGDIDLYVQHTKVSGQLFRNRNGTGTFDDVSRPAGVYYPLPSNLYGPGKAPIWIDYDHDGWLDLYVVMWSFQPVLWHNKGNGTFERVTNAGGLVNDGYGPMGYQWEATSHDFNFDGLPDIWLPGYYGASGLYTNTPLGQSLFTNIAASAGVSITVPTMGPQSEDLNNDGLPELLQGEGSPPAPGPKFLWLNTSNKATGQVSFQDVSSEVGMFAVPNYRMHGGAYFDYDKDGDLDIYTGNGGADSYGWGAYEADQLWRNDGGNTAGNWAYLNLHGTVSNPDGVGARLKIEVGGYTTYQWQLAGQGFSSQNSHWQHLGLGSSNSARVTVEWPSGVVQTVTANAGQWLDVTEPALGNSPILQGVSVDSWTPGERVVTIAGHNLSLNTSVRLANVGNPGSAQVDLGTYLASSLPGATVNADGTRLSFRMSFSYGRYELSLVGADNQVSGSRNLVIR